MSLASNRRGIKPLLYCSAAALALSLQPALSQERSPQQPSAQQGPARTQQPDRNMQPSQRDERAPSATEGQAPDRASSPSQAQDSKQPNSKRARDAQAPDRDGKARRAQPRDDKRDRDQQRAQPRDDKRDRDQQRAQPRDEQQRTRDQAQPRDRDQRDQRDRTATPDRQQDRSRDSARSRDGDRQAAQPTEQQRTRISASIRQANVQPVRNVNFSVSVGTVVPRSVRLYPVTPAIVEVYPQYRGYSFIVVEDEIVIVEPRTKKIVTVIDRGGSTASVSRSKLKLSDRQRDRIRRAAIERRTTGSGSTTVIEREISIGDDLPDTVEIESFPETIYTEIPEIRSYRYVVRDRDIYLVDPSDRRVIEIIR